MDSDHPIPGTERLSERRPWLRGIALAVFVVVVGLWMDLESGFSLLRGTTLARGVVGIIGLGLLAVAAEVTGDAINARDKTSDTLSRRAAHLMLLLSAVAVWLGILWLWPRLLGVAQ
jgi:hypothetical protein